MCVHRFHPPYFIHFQHLLIVTLGLIRTAQGLRPVILEKLKKSVGDEASEEEATALAKSCLPPILTKSKTDSLESYDLSALFAIITHDCEKNRGPKNCQDKQNHSNLISVLKKDKDIVDKTVEAKEVRNEWAHANLSVWTEKKLSDSFKILIDLVEKAECDAQIKEHLVNLRDNGVTLLFGDPVKIEDLKSISEGLHSYFQQIKDAFPKEEIRQTLKLLGYIFNTLDKTNTEEGHRPTQEQIPRTQTLVEGLQVKML